MTRKNKIQHLLITHLLKEGFIELILPDGMRLEVGVVQENKTGELEITPDYCYLVASQNDRSVSMDAYNLGLRFSEERDMIFQDEGIVEIC